MRSASGRSRRWGANSTWYSYDPAGHLLEEDTGAGVAGKSYVYLDNLLIAVLDQVAGTFNYVHTDRLGTPQKITSGAAATVWTGNYQPFGAVTPTGTLTSNIRYPGQYSDAESGLYQNGFRDYLPTFGRYVQSDRIGLGGGINTYGYVGQNPLKYTDVTGQCPICVEVGVIGVTGVRVYRAYRAYEAANTISKALSIPANSWLANDNAENQNDAGSCTTNNPTDKQSKKPPFRGEPGSIQHGDTQGRLYGEDGHPQTDTDLGHGHNEEPHSHDWGRPAGGGEPKNSDRGKPRPIKPGDPILP